MAEEGIHIDDHLLRQGGVRFTEMVYRNGMCPVIQRLILYEVFNYAEDDVSDEDDVNRYSRKSEEEKQKLLRRHFFRHRRDGTWIGSEFLMGKNYNFIIGKKEIGVTVQIANLLVGFAHLLRRQIQVIETNGGRINVFNGAGMEQNIQANPLILLHGHHHYVVRQYGR